MSSSGGVLVIGASAAGLSTLEALRRKGYRDKVAVLGAERHLPYDRPPLSKQVLAGAWDPERSQLRPEPMLSSLDAEFILGDAAVGLDVAARTVHTASGRALRADLLASSRVVVVGDGVLGAELAATAKGMGLTVTMAGPQPAPLASQFGPMVAGLLAQLHAERGVCLRLGTAVCGLTGHQGRVSGVRLETGEVLPADVVVVALGAAPATEWLTGSGVRLDNGLVCDSHCRAAEGIYAAGDVARWYHDELDALVRLENRTNATEQAAVVAANILGEDQTYTPVPYFWTDQFDTRIQVHGMPSADAEVSVVDGDLADRRFVAHYRRNGKVTGVLGWNMPKQTRLHRRHLVDAPLESIT